MSNYINRRLFLTRAGLVAGGVVAGPSLLAACGGGGGRRRGGRHVQGRRRARAVRRIGDRWADRPARIPALGRHGEQKSGGLSIGDKKYKVDLIVQDCKSDPCHRRRRDVPAGHRGRRERHLRRVHQRRAARDGPDLRQVQGAVHRRLGGVAQRLEEAARVHLRRHPRRRHHGGPLDPGHRGHRESQAGHGGGRRRQRAVLRRHRPRVPRGGRGTRS